VYMTAAAAAVIVARKRRRRREQHHRHVWSRQWLLNRTSEHGISNFVDYELRDDMLGFHSFLRMGSSEFNDILNEIAGDIMRMDTVMRDSVTPKERLVVTLRYLASGKPHSICISDILLTIFNIIGTQFWPRFIDGICDLSHYHNYHHHHDYYTTNYYYYYYYYYYNYQCRIKVFGGPRLDIIMGPPTLLCPPIDTYPPGGSRNHSP